MNHWSSEWVWIDRDQILSDAQVSLATKPMHITDAVAKISDGGIHDYYSNADYWWPNPDTADGLPYIRKDGQTNTEKFESHRLILRQCRTHVAALSAAYRLTGETKYAKKAVQFLKEFFLDEETKMNPRLLYAQAIPGVCSGRGIGIIDTLHLMDIVMAIKVLHASESMSLEIYEGLKDWFRDYLEWMTTHPYGIEERDTDNNHSVCWHLQTCVFAELTDNIEVKEFCRQQFKHVLIPDQMGLDGLLSSRVVTNKAI